MYQEYFAACGLKWRYEADPRVVEPLQGQPQWREPLVLLWGLLESPQTLFQRIVRDEPAVAAECLASAVQPKADEQEQLRQRILQVDYRTASDDELRKVLEAIYVLGDGSLLAQHLQERQRHNRLKGIGRQIAEVFTGDEPALRATLDALKQLGKSASAFSQPLLQPLQAKDLKIPAELQREAAQLWRTWRAEYKRAPVHLSLLASAFRLQNLLADDIRQVIESLLQQGQWDAALRRIQEFGLQREAFAEPASAAVRRLLQQRQWKAALEGIQAFGLASRFPPEPIIQRALQQGQWKVALRWIEVFGLQREAFAEAAAAGVRRYLEQRQWKAALRWIEAFGLAARYPPEPIIQKLLQQAQLGAALRLIQEFALQREPLAEPASAAVRRCLEQGRLKTALRGIQEFCLASRFPPEPIIEQLLKRGQWKAALEGIHAFGLASRFPPEPIIERALHRAQWKAALRWIEVFGLQREAFAEAAAAGVRRCLEQGQWEAALRGIQEFCLASRFPPEPIIERLLEQGQWKAALEGIQAFGLASRFPPEPIIERALQQGQWEAALRGIEAFGLKRKAFVEAAAAGVRRLLQQEQWDAALRGIEAFRLQREAFAEPAAAGVRQLLEEGQWEAALRGIEAFGLKRKAFAEAAAAGVRRLLQQGQWEAALRGIRAFRLQREGFGEAAAAGVRRLLQQGQWDAALRGIRAFRLQREAFAEAAAKGVWRLVQQAEYEAAVTGAGHFHVWDLLHDYLADRIHADREKKERCLDWMIAARQSHRRLRTGVATVLLRRYGDVENALALVGSLGFSREQIEHNRALIERVEKINQALAQTGALPEREDMRDLELFGYVHESGWILTPGFRDFRISESAKQHGLVRRVVRFRLVVERRSSDGRLVLNATNLVPA
jgi:hypothetical protein